MKKTVATLVAVTAAVLALRQINRRTPAPGTPPNYGL
jgi:hypothetical protein